MTRERSRIEQVDEPVLFLIRSIPAWRGWLRSVKAVFDRKANGSVWKMPALLSNSLARYDTHRHPHDTQCAVFGKNA
jgi:hypothetical protein